jgi:ribosomal protein L35
MAKLKTRQAVSKRLRVTKNRKIMKKKNGQDHFNAREAGKTTRSKRKNIALNDVKVSKNIRAFLPYSF